MKESGSPTSQSPKKKRIKVTSTAGTSYRRPREPGEPKGLMNIDDSTCYLNSVLQCLTSTPPFANYCQRKLHSTSCTNGVAGNCTLCILEQRIRLQLSYVGPNFGNPAKLHRHIMKSNPALFERGRHEDAHELLSFLIDSCGKSLQPSTWTNEAEKPVLEGLFGGALQSRIQCGQCGATSSKLEDMLGLSVDVIESKSLPHAVSCFFRSEVLDGDNKVHCSGSCNSRSAARKRMSVYQMPKVLTIQLKRYNPLSGKKLAHHVQFEERLSVAMHLSEKFTEAPVPDYTLYGVIAHRGVSQLTGHYVAYAKGTNGKWYLCDDLTVNEVSEEAVFTPGEITANAYLLFYLRSDVNARVTN